MQPPWRPSWRRSGAGGQTPGTPLRHAPWRTGTKLSASRTRSTSRSRRCFSTFRCCLAACCLLPAQGWPRVCWAGLRGAAPSVGLTMLSQGCRLPAGGPGRLRSADAGHRGPGAGAGSGVGEPAAEGCPGGGPAGGPSHPAHHLSYVSASAPARAVFCGPAPWPCASQSRAHVPGVPCSKPVGARAEQPSSRHPPGADMHPPGCSLAGLLPPLLQLPQPECFSEPMHAHPAACMPGNRSASWAPLTSKHVSGGPPQSRTPSQGARWSRRRGARLSRLSSTRLPPGRPSRRHAAPSAAWQLPR